jgi:putative ABC transport system permease protein
MASPSLLLRWSWRDLKSHWVKVLVIALVIGIGTGAFAGLSSSANWRRASNRASVELLNMYDLRVRLATGSTVATGSMTAAAATIAHADWISGAEERLVEPIQVDASHDGDTVLVPGVIVGADVADGGPHINGWYVGSGRGLTAADAGEPRVLLEYGFANHNDLPAEGTIVVSGGRELAYTGWAMTPEFFITVPENSSSFAQGTYAPLLTSLQTAQELAGLPGAVNDLVVTITPDADRDVVAAELESALGSALPAGFTVTTREEDPSYRILFEDVDNDQEFYNVFAFLIFAGAVAAAFNLISRLAESQRREIGIAMALGIPPRRIALRTLLVGAEVAFLGIVFGVAVGTLIGQGMRAVLVDFLPLPVWITDFQWGLFLWVALAGFLVPLAATAYPVWRAVRVRPIEAIRTGHLASRGGGLAPVVQRIHLPGDTFDQMPFRNLMRAPRRSLLTAVGIAAVMAVIVGFFGALDSFVTTLDHGAAEIEGTSPDRVIVQLDGIDLVTSPDIAAIDTAATVGEAVPVLELGGTVSAGDESFDLLIDVMDLGNDVYRPTIVAGAAGPGTEGLVLAEGAADDLGVGVGDTVTLTHPFRTGPTTFTLVDTEVRVAATHPNPFRFVSYLDQSQAGLFGAAGLVNVVDVTPAPDATSDDVIRELFTFDGVASVQKASAAADELDELLAQFIGILQIVGFAVLILAVLIAFNSASIAVEERAREYATMFAYGVPVRTALRMAVVENGVIGVVATVFGFAGGMGILWWFINSLAAETIPDISLELMVSPATLVAVVAVGVAAVALAPLFTARRLRRMDLPGTLRIME